MVGFFDSGIWKKAPFLRLLLPVISGVLIQDIFPISKWVSITVISIVLVLTAFSLLVSAVFFFSAPGVSGFLLNLLLTGTGCQLLLVHQDSPFVARTGPGAAQRLIVEVQTAPARKKTGVSCVVSVLWELRGRRCFLRREQLLVYFRDSGIVSGWEPGTRRLLQARWQPIRNGSAALAKGIQGFDFVTWCARRHIHARVFTIGDDGLLLSAPRAADLRSQLARIQDKLRLICRRYVPDPKQGGLLEALLIGYTRDLDPEVLRSYSEAGVVHIIAISGLHLALIGELLQLLLLRLGHARAVRTCRLLLLLTVIWGYSLLTGASPSVLRSAVMFSFVVLARHFALQAPVYNALAASAFLLICDDPYRLWDTGFQLSYAAVLSLVLFVSPVRAWLTPKNKGLIALWNAASVSLAAQVLTTPVSIWYFHRFPFYFLVSNLVAVPLSGGILLGGIALLGLAGFPVVARLLGSLLGAGLGLMNTFVAATNRLPGAAATGIIIHPLQVILCYSMLYSCCRFAEKGRKGWFFFLLIQLCVFLMDGLNN